MRNTILTIILATLAASCSKDDAPLTVTYGASYTKKGISAPPAVRLFAGSGEIKDAATIGRFNALDSEYARYGSNDLANQRGYMDTLVFESQSGARITQYFQRYRYSVIQNGGNLTLSSVDTFSRYISGIEMSRSLLYFLPQQQRVLYSEGIYGVSQGQYIFNYRFQDKLNVKSGGGQDIDVPIIMCSWYKDKNIYTRDFITGLLNSGFYKHISSGDTVAIREFDLHFAK